MLEEAQFGSDVHPLKDDFVGDVGSVLWVLLGSVGMVLLIACANVANLFLVRADGRQREVAVRMAMGAPRGEITKQFLVESVMLGVMGGAVGLGLSFVGLRALVSLGPTNLPRLNEVGIDPLVLTFTMVVSVLAGLFFGVFPAIKYRKLDLVTSLKEGGRGAADGRERHRARSALVIAQVALAMVLLIGSGLMIRSFQALREVHPGFERPEEVLTFRVAIPRAEIEDPAEAGLAYELIQQNLAAVPGVASVGASFSVTMDGYDSQDALWMEDFPTPEGQLPPIRRFKWITPGYFETMENRLLAGRAISWMDIHDRQPVVVITENFASEYWDNPADAIGKRVGSGSVDPSEARWVQIVGVVGDVRDNGLDQDAVTIAYWPLMSEDFWGEEVFVQRTMRFAVRAQGPNPSALLAQARSSVWNVNPNLPLADVQTLDEILERSLSRTSFTLLMLAIAGGVALIIGTIGIYGVVSYVVSQRTREIGVRMAIGAERSDVSTMVVRQGMLVSLLGVVIGLAAALGLTRLMGSLLYGVETTDPMTYGIVAVALSVVAFLASYVPAIRAASVDPVEALRWE